MVRPLTFKEDLRKMKEKEQDNQQQTEQQSDNNEGQSLSIDPKYIADIVSSTLRAQQEAQQTSAKPVVKPSLVTPNTNLDDIKANIEKMRDKGVEEDEILAYMERAVQNKVEAVSSSSNFDIIWAEYKANSPDLFNSMSKIEQDMYKDHFKRSQLGAVVSSDNPFGVLDSFFEDKIKKLAESKDSSSEAKEDYQRPLKGQSGSSPTASRPKSQDKAASQTQAEEIYDPFADFEIN